MPRNETVANAPRPDVLTNTGVLSESISDNDALIDFININVSILVILIPVSSIGRFAIILTSGISIVSLFICE